MRSQKRETRQERISGSVRNLDCMKTVSPPLLLNQRSMLHIELHPSVPRSTGFLLSDEHLCLFLSLSLPKVLLHTSQVTWRTTGIDGSVALCSLWFSRPRPRDALHAALDVVALSYHWPSSRFMSFKSLRMTSFHLLFGPERGRG